MASMRRVIPVLMAVLAVTMAEMDFYETLGINRDANGRDIRKAFKKAALKYHPDKNDEPDAHTKFLRINRAYEVLKDDDLRRKYDTHGEAGLDENAGNRGQYQSWNYYQQDFGLYDDDQEIVTLSVTDFDLLVLSSNDTWFINFYSPGCPPCHRLAPTWREVAREIDGIVRVGAVNCMEDRQLCQEQGINAYPSLFLYPRKLDRYQGDKSKDALVNYALENVQISFHQLSTNEFFESTSFPWFVHFCDPGDDGDCLSERAMLRLSGMLSSLMNVGFVDCEQNPMLCKEHQAGSGMTKYFPRKTNKPQMPPPVELPTSLDIRELCAAAISHLPKARVFTEKSFNLVRSRIHAEPVLILFGAQQSISEDNEVRKLSSLLPDMEVGVVDCTILVAVCAEYHVVNNDATMLLKPKGYELFYGKRQALNVAAFARESAMSSVRALGPEDFPTPVTQGDFPFFVDFFAPWCPPCRRLLPQFRKAAAGISSVKFGTVDCVVHKDLCSNYNVHSYPTSILFNSSTPHQYSGSHSAGEIVEFAQDILQPSVLELTPETFEAIIGKRKTKTTVLVDFYFPSCPPCVELAPTWNKLAKLLKDTMPVAKIDCARYKSFCREQSPRGYPTMRAYPEGHTGTGYYQDYQGWRNLPSLRNWALSFLPRLSDTLHAHNFDSHVLHRHDRPYIVLFTAGQWCGPCQSFGPEFESVARKLKDDRYIMGFGVLDCDQNRHKCGEAQIHQYPMMKVYEGDVRYAHDGMVISSQVADEIIRILLDNVHSIRRKPKKAKKEKAHDEL